ncbi:unnamed protein product [Miscanthus lutarioriparius]|uniref:Uncharacterized protein n=1 Tax=Miscanthus lutarioriparius TaxID=422564 RepID=A0A811RTV2_9POAL|nr:unnamed protein product [Miscanthus lutarioriparius]CAD6273224.1 unnamed protein product [Miscanthus lutarioriparius]
MAMELPLILGDGPDAALFSSLWSSFPDDLQQPPQESVAELKQTLLATTMELEAAREELKRKEQSIAKLAELVREVAKERDDARDQMQSLRLLAAQAAAAAAAAPAPPLVTSSFTDSDCSLVSSPVDPFFDPVTSADRRGKLSPATPPAASSAVAPKRQCQPGGGGVGVGSAADAVLDMLASKRPLPHKGRLLAAVMEAGPLLQNLLVAGQLPRWRNPPTVRAPDTLPLGAARAGYVGAPVAAAGSDAVTLASSACMKRPMSMLPLTPMLPAASCSPGFIAKRQRLH